MPAFIFDLDGTLVDTVYPHVLAWHAALAGAGYDVPMWRIHRKIGMSGTLLIHALELEVGSHIESGQAKRLEQLHTQEMRRMQSSITVFAGVHDLFATLDRAGVPYAIASSGTLKDIGQFLQMLQLSDRVPVITGDDAPNAKPDPDSFAGRKETQEPLGGHHGRGRQRLGYARRAARALLGCRFAHGRVRRERDDRGRRLPRLRRPARTLQPVTRNRRQRRGEIGMERERFDDEDEPERESVEVDPPAYAETDADPNREDQRDAHHAEPDEHV